MGPMVKVIMLVCMYLQMAHAELTSSSRFQDIKSSDFITSDMSANKKRKIKGLIEDLKQLNKSQVEVLKKSLIGDLGVPHLYAAIAWQESSFRMNAITMHNAGKMKYKGCYGPYQALGDVVMKEHNVQGSSFKEITTKLTTDIEYAQHILGSELSTWKQNCEKKIVKRKLSKERFAKEVLASYNVGWLGTRSTKASKYADDVLLKAKILVKVLHNETSTNNIAAITLSKTKYINKGWSITNML